MPKSGKQVTAKKSANTKPAATISDKIVKAAGKYRRFDKVVAAKVFAEDKIPSVMTLANRLVSKNVFKRTAPGTFVVAK